MGIPEELQERITRWDGLSRWERTEIGRDLRRLGLSYGEIRNLIDVKKSTLATWCREIQLTDEQAEAIRERTGSRAGIPVDTQWRRRLEIQRIRCTAQEEGHVLIDDPFWIAGVVLYWAEGAKTSRRLSLSHSEPEALRMFQAWTRRFLDPYATFKAALNLHADNNERAARDFWAAELQLDPVLDFTKTFVKPDGTGHRKNHLAYGVCELKMLRSTDPWITTMAWVDVLRNRWSD